MEKIVIAENQKNRDVETLFQAYDNLSNLYNVLFSIAKRYNYADMGELYDSVIEFSGQIALIANQIFAPEAINFVDAVIEKENAFNRKINSVK